MTLTTIVPIAMELCHLGTDGTVARRPSIVSIASSIPGRLRLRVLERRGDERFARQVEAALAAITGVTEVCTNPVTGSVLVRFDPGQLDADRILAELERWGLLPTEGKSAQTDSPPAAAPLGKMAVRIGTSVGKELAKSVMLEALGEAWFAPLLALL
jgi:hypothetical protein